jgi:Xaa-Pro aminopeptidase
MYPHQAERLSQTLESAGLAALVGTTAENVAYITGFRSLNHAVFRTLHFALYTPRGTALVGPAVEVAPIIADGVEVDHIAVFGGFVAQYAEPLGEMEARIRAAAERRHPSPGHAVAAALDALGVTSGVIGLDEGGLTHPAWEGVTARLAGFTVVPAADRLWSARRVKSPYEIECLEKSLQLTEEAVDAVLQKLEPGATERETVAAYGAEVLKRGGTPYPASIAFGERTWIVAPPPTDRPLRRGDLVRFDVGCVFKGYYSSLARIAVMEEPDHRQQAAANAVQAGLEAAIKAIAPRTAAGRVHEAAVSATRAAGLPAFQRYHVGHGIGLEPYERPKLMAGNATPLEAGEVLRVEIPYYEVGWAGLNLRDTVLVTATSSHVMNRSVRSLVVLD